MKTEMKEDAHTEFKESFTNKIIKAAVAFSNGSGGTIYVGIKDDGEIIGVDNQDVESNRIISSLLDNVRPSINGSFSLETVDMYGKDVIRVTISEGSNKPYYWKEKGLREGGVFLRNGPVNIPASEPLILKMVRESPGTPYESLPSREQDLTFDETRRIFESNDLLLKDENMVSIGMLDKGVYTNLAYMLSDQFPQGIKASVFNGNDKTSFQDRDEYSGSLLHQLEKAYGFIDKHNSRRARIEGIYRRDSRDYPEAAVREALINALVHRDYALNGDILIEMYSDRLSVSSMGGLNRGLSLDDLLLGMSSRRNEKLASIFVRLGLMETYGTGLPKIMGLYSEQPFRPKVEVSTNVFKITLPKTTDIRLSDDMLRTLAVMNEGPKSRSQLEEALGIPRMRMLEILKDLKSMSMVEEMGKGRSTVYKRIV